MKKIFATFAAVVLGLTVSLVDADVRFFAATALSSTVLFNGGGTTLIAANTVDGADNGVLALAGGGARGLSRGGFIDIAGNEASSGGYVQINGGNTATGDIAVLLNNASGTFDIWNSSTAKMWTWDNNAAQLFTQATSAITSVTADAADNGILYLSGGGGGTGVGSARGAFIGLAGNENGSTGALTLAAGNVGGGVVNIAAGGATRWTSASDGTFIGAGTGTIGWAVVDGADNTACSSQCTAPAVFGFNLAAGATAPVLVGPSDATADICLCAGSS